jgi:S-adenosylmethionine synthetase
MDKVPSRDQVTVFGFACDQTPALMPLPIWLAHKISHQLSVVRIRKQLPYLMPDGKVQVGVEYKKRVPSRIHGITITASQRKPEDPDLETLHRDLLQSVVNPVFADEPIKPDEKTQIHINPDGPFLIGGPTFHTGLTGRKTAVDTYGEFARHSGNALSGKDPTRIDRAGTYAARHAAKNIVAAGLATRCEVQVSYAIGEARPVSVQVETFGTGTVSDERLGEIAEAVFDLRLAAILKRFNLRHLPALNPEGFFQKLAVHGHVGRTDLDLPWEKTEAVESLTSQA